MTRIGSTAYVCLILDLSPSVVRMLGFIASTGKLPDTGYLRYTDRGGLDAKVRRFTLNGQT
jgi:hypothetical protein